MVKFLVSRDLLVLADFAAVTTTTTTTTGTTNSNNNSNSNSNSSLVLPDYATVDVGHILATLRQCPSYQIDKHHTNCGLRTRMLPILEHIQAMLSSGAVAVSRPAWRGDREAASWLCCRRHHNHHHHRHRRRSSPPPSPQARVFRFTRAMLTDQRLRYEGALGADSLARELFTADEWDWTPDEDEMRGQGTWRWR